VAGTGIKFRDVPVPVLLMEPNLMAPMQMTAAAASDHGTVANQTQVTILADTEGLAGGRSGNVTVYSAPYRMVFGIPGAEALKIASVLDSTTQMAIFAYRAGAPMVGANAPGKRLAFFLHNSAAANVAGDGLGLLDAAVVGLTAP
jgi:hypothetical protein